MTKSALASLTLSGCLAVVTAGVWWGRMAQSESAGKVLFSEDPWKHVSKVYPLPEPPPPAGGLTAQALDAVVNANPFSATRRYVPPPVTGTGTPGDGQAGLPARPQLVFKGRINMGSRQRAIVEDAAAKKTYFLEVGQEVAGLKVLDITETQVLLSDPKTREEVALLLTSPGKP